MIQTICALANDVDFGGGYIIIGIDEEIDEGAPFLPPTGLRIIAELNKSDLENIQK
jgi:predicted HTH transcriptional regulator